MTHPIASTGLSIVLDTYEYIVDTKASGEKVDGKMIAWYGITNIAGGVLDEGVGIALGDASHTLIDECVETLAQSSTNTMTNTAIHKAEKQLKEANHPTSNRTDKRQNIIPKGTP